MRFWHWQTEARRRTRWLLLAFALCVLVVVAAVHLGLSLAWWLLPGQWAYPGGFVATNIGVTLLLVLGGWWLEAESLSAGGPALARRIGARELRPDLHFSEQQLQNVVQELCLAAQMLPPQIMLLPRTEAINAFAAGWLGDGDDKAVLTVTQGALDHLSRDELAGLVAHELSHLHEGDTRLNMQLGGMAHGLELIHHFGCKLREHSAPGWWFGNVVMAAGFVGWLCAQLLKAAVSREREFLADARAVQWTRNKDSLGGVLRKLMTQQQRELRAYGPAGNPRAHHGLDHPAVRHMLLVDAPQATRFEQWLSRRWLDTHPPLAERVRRIYGRRMPALALAPAGPVAEPRFHEF